MNFCWFPAHIRVAMEEKMMLLSPLNAILHQGSSPSVWSESGGGGVPHSEANSQSKLLSLLRWLQKLQPQIVALLFFPPAFSAMKCTLHRNPQLLASYTHQTPGSEPPHIQTRAEISPEVCICDTGLPMYRRLLDSKYSQTTSNTAWADKIQQLVNSAHKQL